MAKQLKPIPKNLIIDKMKFENPWWETSRIEDEYQSYKEREYFQLFYPLVKDTDIKRAVVLMGPRRVGKTVMMHHAIQDLLTENHVEKDKIAFINIENPLFIHISLEQLFKIAMEATNQVNPKGWFVFFDEIQYLKNWEVHLKVLVDSYPNTKFIVSGSAAAALKLKSTESGAGRFTDFMLPPLTFHEYISLKGFNRLLQKKSIVWNNSHIDTYTTEDIIQFNKHFIDYINFGGYPEIIFSEKIQSNLSRYVKSDIVDKVLLRDLPSLYGIQNVQELNSFFTKIAYYSGNEVSLSSLSTNSGVDTDTLRKYVEYLEAAFLIKRINKIDDSAKKFKRVNNYKIFLTNPSLRTALFAPVKENSEDIGCLVETAIYSQWLHRESFTPWYARWKNGEVDMVGLDSKTQKPIWAVEIKWSNRAYEKPYEELKMLIYFCKKHKIETALVTTLDKEGTIDLDGVKINFMPSSLYAYLVGVNTIILKSH